MRFFLCLARCPLSVFRSSLSLRVAVWKNCWGANFGFLWSVVVLCFSVVFCLGFRFMVWHLAPETVKKSLHVGSPVLCFCFFGFSFYSSSLLFLFLGLARVSHFFSFSSSPCPLRRSPPPAGRGIAAQHSPPLYLSALSLCPRRPSSPSLLLALSLSLYLFSGGFVELNTNNNCERMARRSFRVRGEQLEVSELFFIIHCRLFLSLILSS